MLESMSTRPGGYMFQSPRLGFRRWRSEDSEPFARLNADPTVMRFFPKTRTRAESDDNTHNNSENPVAPMMHRTRKGIIVMIMGKTKTQKSSKQIIVDDEGNPTHVVLTVAAYEEMEELIEDLQAFHEYQQTKHIEKNIPWEEAERLLDLQS